MATHSPATPLLYTFNDRAPLEDVLEAVKIAYGRTGCNPCGRLSLLIKADEGIDPIVDELRQIKSLRSVQELAPHVGVRA